MNDPQQKKDQIIARLERRTKKLAREKAHLQLNSVVLSQLADCHGLDQLIKRCVTLLTDTIGGTNIIIYYKINENEWCYRDVYNLEKTVTEIEDAQVHKAMAMRSVHSGLGEYLIKL